MKRFLMGGTAALAIAAAAGPAPAQEVLQSLLDTLPMVEASGYEVERSGGDEIVTNLTLRPVADKGQAPEDASLTIDRLVFSDVGELADDSQTAVPPFGGVTVEGVRMAPDAPEEGEVTVERASVSGADFPAVLEWALGLAEPDPAMLADLESLRIEGVAGDIPEEEMTFSLGSLSVENVQAMMVGSFRMEDLAFETREPGDEGSVAIDRVEVTGIDLSSMIEAMQGDEEDIAELLTQVPVASSLMTGIAIDAPDFSATLESIETTDIEVEDGITTSMTVRMTNLVIPVDSIEDEEFAAPLRDAGFEEVVLNLGLGYAIDLANGVLTMDEFRFSADRMGALDAEITVSGLPVEAFQDFDSITEEQAAAISLDHFRFTIEDEGMIEMGLGFAEEETGQSREALIQQVAGGVGLGIGMLGGVPALADAPQTVEQFVRESGKLTLTLAPENPIPIMEAVFSGMANPGQAIEMLAPSLMHE